MCDECGGCRQVPVYEDDIIVGSEPCPSCQGGPA